MENSTKVLIAAGTVFAISLWLSAGASANPTPPSCKSLSPNIRYYFDYPGPRKLLPDAIGAEAWAVINYVEFWDPLTGDWIQPADPENDILENGSLCRVWVQSPCRLCGFTPV